MKNPLEAILNWYNQLPIDIKHDVAAFALLTAQDSQSWTDGDSLIQEFEKWLNPVDLSSFAIIRKSVLLKNSFEIFLADRFTQASWDRVEETHQALKEKAPHLYDKTTPVKDRIPAWFSQVDPWNNLVNQYLSADALQAFYDYQSMKELKAHLASN